MNLNYVAFFLISFVPLIIGYAWYHPNNPVFQGARAKEGISLAHLSIAKLIVLFLLSFAIVYGYINLIIHQMGFYELFFTDIMLGKDGAKEIVANFLSEYGTKHRHFGHGVFHGLINAFVFAAPFVGVATILENKSWGYFKLHFGYWLLTSVVIGGLISAFV